LRACIFEREHYSRKYRRQDSGYPEIFGNIECAIGQYDAQHHLISAVVGEMDDFTHQPSGQYTENNSAEGDEQELAEKRADAESLVFNKYAGKGSKNNDARSIIDQRFPFHHIGNLVISRRFFND